MICNSNMFWFLLQSHLQVGPQKVIHAISNALYSTRSRLHVIKICYGL